MKKNIFFLTILILSLPIIVGTGLQVSHAQTTNSPQYTLLAPLPCISGSGQNCTAGTPITTINIQDYFLYLFKLAIAAAVFLAVVMITWGGFKYMTQESITAKGSAKETIQNAVWGLLGALCSWLILYTINPQLVNLSLVTVPSLHLTVNPNVLTQQNLNNAIMEDNAVALAAIANATQDRAQAAAAQATADKTQQELDDHCDADLGANDYSSDQCTALENQLASANAAVSQNNNNASAAEAAAAMTNISNDIMKGIGTLGTTNTLQNLTQQYQTALAAANANNDVTGEQALTNQYAIESEAVQGKAAFDNFISENTGQNQSFFNTSQSDTLNALQTAYTAAKNSTTDPATLTQLQTQYTAQVAQVKSATYTPPASVVPTSYPSPL